MQTRLGRGRHLAAQKVGVTTMVIYSFVYMIYSASDAAQAQKKLALNFVYPASTNICQIYKIYIQYIYLFFVVV